MEWADDITYAIHDVEDFGRLGTVPLDDLLLGDETWEGFSEWMTEKWATLGREDASQALASAFGLLRTHLPLAEYSRPTERDRLLSRFASAMIHDCITRTTLANRRSLWILKRPNDLKLAIDALKELIWYFVIGNPKLKAAQVGQRKAVRTIFEYFHGEAKRITHRLSHANLPPATRRAATILARLGRPVDAPRIACDALCELNELQASRLYLQLVGAQIGQSDLFGEPQQIG